MNLNKILLFALLISSCFLAHANNSSSEIEMLEGRLEDLELRSALKKFNFSGSFHNQIESFHQTRSRTNLHNDKPAGVKEKLLAGFSDEDVYILPMAMRVDLNFDARVSKNLMFYSTIGMSKFLNMADREGRGGDDNANFKSLRGSYGYEDSGAKFDTAFLKYQFEGSAWSLALGRMTTNNGPPHNKLDGLSRSGTYPFMAYNVIFDGMALIYDFKNWMPKGNSLKMRAFYTPFIQLDDEQRSEQVIDGAEGGGSGERVESHGSFTTLLTEYSNSNFDWVKRLDLFYAVYTFDQYYANDRQFVEGNPPSSEYEPYYNDGVDYEGTTAHTVYIGLDKLWSSGLSLSFSLNHFDIRSTGLGTETSSDYLATLNYTFDNSLNSNHILGLEYINNDENKIPTDSTTMYINSFYNLSNGEGVHLYYTIPKGASQVIRFGVFNFNEDESTLLRKDIKAQTQATYLSYKVFF
jgi:hypothetical protein